MKNNSTVRDLTVGDPMKLIIGFALSLFLGMIFQQLYNIIDTAIVSWFLGKEAYTGVGTTGAINFLIMGFCMGVCNGFAIPVAQAFGAKDETHPRHGYAADKRGLREIRRQIRVHCYSDY